MESALIHQPRVKWFSAAKGGFELSQRCGSTPLRCPVSRYRPSASRGRLKVDSIGITPQFSTVSVACVD